VPMANVSITLRILARLGMANAIGAGIWLTAPYGKSPHRGQMRQRDCSNAYDLKGFAHEPGFSAPRRGCCAKPGVIPRLRG
jgi:hypothetical protein